MSLNLEALKGLQLATVEKKTTVTKTVKLPEGMRLRVFKDGRIYPSADLAVKYELQYAERVETVNPDMSVTSIVPGYGLDFFSSTEWNQIPEGIPAMVLGSFIPRTEKVISVWGSCKYNKDGEPTSDVFEQGAAAKVKSELVPMLALHYNVDWKTTDYVDLEFSWENQLSSANGLYQVPKRKITGTHKGEVYQQLRENIEIYPLILAEDLDLSGADTTEEEMSRQEPQHSGAH